LIIFAKIQINSLRVKRMKIINIDRPMKIEVLLSSYIGRLFLLSAFTFPVISNLHFALLILLAAFIADFFTGWLASYMEIKRGDKPMPASGRSFESKKARESVVKGISYILLILGSVAMEFVFFDRKFNFSSLTQKELGVTELVVGFCFSIELYSTIMENMKRAGFDVVAKITTASDVIWKLIKKVKGQ
jgi:hypothetical protein